MCSSDCPEKEKCHCQAERTHHYMQPRLLLQLAKNSAHGYELMEALAVDDENEPNPGNLYRALRSFEEDGLVKSSWDTTAAGPARRVYEITDQGLDYLQTWAVNIKKVHKQLGNFLTDFEKLLKKE
jgi:PadR family transcriptional regulator PadR